MRLALHNIFGVLSATALLCLVFAVRTAISASAQSSESVLLVQSQADAERKSTGCLTCHTATDNPTMHVTGTVRLGCADCHGGNSEARILPGTPRDFAAYAQAKSQAHPQPRDSKDARSSANPERAYTSWLRENWDYVRFVNPGDLRVAEKTCGTSGCHTAEVRKVQTSMMTHGAMLWGAALYNNGAVPFKTPQFGESYGPDGSPRRLTTFPPPTPEEISKKGILPYLEPLERWEISQPGNVLRVFDQPGDYRASGCSACHVIYANDRSPEHSGAYATHGNLGQTATSDPTIPRNESGHAIRHQFTRSIPSSQCMVCHIHPGTNMVSTYFGYTWWDNEMDGEHMWPAEQRRPNANEQNRTQTRNPEGSAVRGLWADTAFLEKTGTPEFNQQLQHTQFADFHSHGWIFRAVFKHDRKGNLLDADDKVVSFDDPDKLKKAVHLKDIHLEKGMHCVDCHFEQDSHGNGKLYGETRNAIEIDCVDCHGTIQQRGSLVTSGTDAPAGGTNLAGLRTPWQERRFYWKEDRLYQRSMLDKEKEWEVVQVRDTITPGNTHYNEKSRLAKTIQQDGHTWGDVPPNEGESKLAHQNGRMTCYTCHSSWAPTCYGCHLSMTANQRTPMLHNEGLTTRNWTSYNFQILRDDIYTLGIDGTVTGNRVAPVRSACAVLVSSQNNDRDWLYYQQQTMSAEGFSGQAFSTFVPHTVRGKETELHELHGTVRFRRHRQQGL